MRVEQVDLHGRPADHERRDDCRDQFRHALLALGHLFALGILSQHVDDQPVEYGDDDQRNEQAEQREEVGGDASSGIQEWTVVTEETDANIVGARVQQNIVVEPAKGTEQTMKIEVLVEVLTCSARQR